MKIKNQKDNLLEKKKLLLNKREEIDAELIAINENDERRCRYLRAAEMAFDEFGHQEDCDEYAIIPSTSTRHTRHLKWPFGESDIAIGEIKHPFDTKVNVPIIGAFLYYKFQKLIGKQKLAVPSKISIMKDEDIAMEVFQMFFEAERRGTDLAALIRDIFYKNGSVDAPALKIKYPNIKMKG